MNLTPEEQDLMTRVVLGEASSDPTERAGVAWNILNRVGKPEYGNSIRDVIYQRNAYTSVHDPQSQFYRGGQKAYADARNIVNGVASGNIGDPTSGAPNFLAASMPPEQRPQWAQGEGQKIGKTIFYGGNPTMSKDEADQYLAARRAKSGQNQPASMSKDEADQYLERYRAQRGAPEPSSQAVSTEGAAPSGAPVAPATAPEAFPQGVGLSTLFHDLPPSLQNLIREHPYMTAAGAAAAIPIAGALLPEEALGAAAGWAARNVVWPAVRVGAGYAGLDWMTGGNITPKIIEMLGRMGEAGGTAP